MVFRVGVPHSTNHVETIPRARSSASNTRSALWIGLRPMAVSAEPSVRATRRSSPLRASSARRSAVNTGQRSTTSRSCVIAAAQRRPSGHGASSATGRRPALSTTALRSSAAARATTGSATRLCWTNTFSVEGTRPNRSRALERCSAAPVAISPSLRRTARAICTTASPRSMCQWWAAHARRSSTPPPGSRSVISRRTTSLPFSTSGQRDKSTRRSRP